MQPRKVYTAIGLMSGTSLDGVDCTLIETDGYDIVRPRGFVTRAYDEETRAKLRACFGMRDKDDPRVKDAARLLTLKHADAVRDLLAATKMDASQIDVIGFHGQTIFHAPRAGVTVQIGDGALLARETSIAVVDDMRSNDVAHGGEGAPLAPLYHRARIRAAGLERPVVVLNIGGVGNVTWIGEGDCDMLAFDTGPGNAMMDDWARSRTGAPYDEDGKLAASGTPRMDIVAAWLDHDYFNRPPPKSMDRNQWDIADLGERARELSDLSDADGAATLLHFTVEAMIRAVDHMPALPHHWYACGGGRHNLALMHKLAARLHEEGYGALHNVDALGWNGDATEGECFAYLAVRSLLGEYLSLPGTTGVPHPVSGGVLHKAGA